MAKNLYSSGDGGEPVGMDEMEQRFVEERVEGQTLKGRYGHGSVMTDKDLLPFDISMAQRDPVPFGADSNRKMSRMEGRAALKRLLELRGLGTEVESVQWAFVQAMLLAHAKNSASIRVPDRAWFYVGAGESRTNFNYYHDVVSVLGADARRFFRTYADFTLYMLKGLFKQRGSSDPQIVADLADLDWVAADRGLTRAPYLVHDSADACSHLSPYERTLLSQSKASVLADSVNVVDAPRFVPQASGRVNSASPVVGGVEY